MADAMYKYDNFFFSDFITLYGLHKWVVRKYSCLGVYIVFRDMNETEEKTVHKKSKSRRMTMDYFSSTMTVRRISYNDNCGLFLQKIVIERNENQLVSSRQMLLCDFCRLLAVKFQSQADFVSTSIQIFCFK